MDRQLHIAVNAEENGYQASEFFIESGLAALKSKGRFVVSLAGGSTPKKMYEMLSMPPFNTKIDWKDVFILWGDERCVPEDSPESNSRMAREAFLNKVPIPEDQIYPINGVLPPEEGAQQYETQIKALFGHAIDGIDLCLLGLGDDGHTASLFPHTNVLEETEKWVSAVFVEKMNSWRITLTKPVIRASKQLLFLVNGSKKADVLPKILNGPFKPNDYPSQIVIQDHPDVHWFLDEAAASKLNA